MTAAEHVSHVLSKNGWKKLPAHVPQSVDARLAFADRLVIEHRPKDNGDWLWLWIYGKEEARGREPDRRVVGLEYGDKLEEVLGIVVALQNDLSLDNYAVKYLEFQRACAASIVAFEQFDWQMPEDCIAENYAVSLLFPALIKIDLDAVWTEFSRLRTNAARLWAAEFAYAAGKPARFSVVASGPLDYERVKSAFEHTLDWRGLGEVMQQAAFAIDVADFDAADLPRKERLAAFIDGLRALITVHKPLAVHWTPAQRIVDPEAILQATMDDAFYLSWNVRAWRGGGKATPEDVCFMDTRGMGSFGLWDLEVRYREMPPSEMAHNLSVIAERLWNGAILKRHDNVAGFGKNHRERWDTEWARASVPPDRPVLRIKAGKHAAW